MRLMVRWGVYRAELLVFYGQKLPLDVVKQKGINYPYPEENETDAMLHCMQWNNAMDEVCIKHNFACNHGIP